MPSPGFLLRAEHGGQALQPSVPRFRAVLQSSGRVSSHSSRSSCSPGGTRRLRSEPALVSFASGPQAAGRPPPPASPLWDLAPEFPLHQLSSA